MRIQDSGMDIGKTGYCLLPKHTKGQHTLDQDCWQALRHYLFDTGNADYDTYVNKCKKK